MYKTLEEMTKRISVLVGQNNLDKDEMRELEELNASASALKAKLDGQKVLDAQREADKVALAEAAEKEKREAVAEAVKLERAKFAAEQRRPEFYGEAPYQSKYSDTNKYDNLSAGETAFVIDVLNSQNKPVSGGAFKALSLKIAELKDDNTEEGKKSVNYVKNAFKMHNPTIGADLSAVEAAVKAATDPMYSGGSGIGSDWVGTAYSSELWRTIRGSNVLVGKVPEKIIPDGYSSIYFPLESTDPTWYKVPEVTTSDSTMKFPAATVTASQFATANKQLTVGKIGSRVQFSGEMTEDSLIAFAEQARNQLAVSGAEILEHLMIDGDVETSANKNINDIAGTPGATDVFLLNDGFRKLALVTNTANSRSAGGAFVIKDFSDTLKLMGTAGLAGADPRQVAFLVDYNVHWAAMNLPEALTRDVYTAATFENGFLKQAYGYQVMPAFQMHRISSDRKAQTDGKIDQDTTADNTTGAILAVRFDQWVQAFKRRMTLETTRIANADSWEIVALARWGMTYRDTEAAAITYNVGI